MIIPYKASAINRSGSNQRTNFIPCCGIVRYLPNPWETGRIRLPGPDSCCGKPIFFVSYIRHPSTNSRSSPLIQVGVDEPLLTGRRLMQPMQIEVIGRAVLRGSDVVRQEPMPPKILPGDPIASVQNSSAVRGVRSLPAPASGASSPGPRAPKWNEPPGKLRLHCPASQRRR